jgi:hypothetical protein
VFFAFFAVRIFPSGLLAEFHEDSGGTKGQTELEYAPHHRSGHSAAW